MLAWRSIWTFLQQPPLSRFYSYFKSAFLRRLFCVTVFCLENFFNFLLHFSWLLFAGLIDFYKVLFPFYYIKTFFRNSQSKKWKIFTCFYKTCFSTLNLVRCVLTIQPFPCLLYKKALVKPELSTIWPKKFRYSVFPFLLS